MRQMILQHFPNEKAHLELSKHRISEINCTLSSSLITWLDGISLYNGYLISPIENAPNQINNCKEYIKSDFGVEIKLNKIYLDDDYPDGLDKIKYAGIYFNICNFLQIFLLKHKINQEVIAWYSTDSYNEIEEYTSHTVSFGLKRSDEDTYPLNSDNFQDVFHIGTVIAVASP